MRDTLVKMMDEVLVPLQQQAQAIRDELVAERDRLAAGQEAVGEPSAPRTAPLEPLADTNGHTGKGGPEIAAPSADSAVSPSR